jgi:hypothetical protein
MMKRLWVLLLVPAILLAGCSQLTPEIDVEAAKSAALEETAEVLSLVVEGEEAELEAYLEENDPTGEIRAALEEDPGRGLFFPDPEPAPAPDWVSEPVATDFLPGDVVLFEGMGTTWQGSLMDLVLVDAVYSHAGFVSRIEGDEVIFVSASIETSPEGEQVNGLCYQTLSALKETSGRIARLRYASVPPQLPVAAAAFEYFYFVNPAPPTLYSFILLDPDQLLRPVPKDDPFWWYCSKVPWVLYLLDPATLSLRESNLDIEGAAYYFTDDRWKDQRASLLYRILFISLKFKTGSWWTARRVADAVLREVLDELVSPDELRAGAGLTEVWHRAGHEEVF